MKDEVDHVNDESFDGNIPGSEELFKRQIKYESDMALCSKFIRELQLKSLVGAEEQEAHLKASYTPEEAAGIMQVLADIQRMKSMITPEMLGDPS